MDGKTQAPRDLSPEAREWWSTIAEDYDLKISDYKILTLAARQLDRATEARQSLKKHGLVLVDKHGVCRPRAEIIIERNATVLFARLVRELRLGGEADPDPRIPRLQQERR